MMPKLDFVHRSEIECVAETEPETETGTKTETGNGNECEIEKGRRIATVTGIGLPGGMETTELVREGGREVGEEGEGRQLMLLTEIGRWQREWDSKSSLFFFFQSFNHGHSSVCLRKVYAISSSVSGTKICSCILSYLEC